MVENFVDIYDIYGYYTLPFWHSMWFKVGVGLACICLLLGLSFLIYKKRARITPYQWAVHELEKLSRVDLTSRSDGKRCYFALTNLLKEYLQRRYDWKIIDKTDKELISWLQNSGAPVVIIESTQKIANNAEWVKFANVDALKPQIESDIAMVKQMLDQTKPTN